MLVSGLLLASLVTLALGKPTAHNLKLHETRQGCAEMAIQDRRSPEAQRTYRVQPWLARVRRDQRGFMAVDNDVQDDDLGRSYCDVVGDQSSIGQRTNSTIPVFGASFAATVPGPGAVAIPSGPSLLDLMVMGVVLPSSPKKDTEVGTVLDHIRSEL